MMKVEPVVLEGRHVRLEPMAQEHVPDLWEAAQDDDIWRYMPATRPVELSAMQNIVDAALKLRAGGTVMPFVTISKATGKIAGSTRYLDIQPANRGLEIGWTWLGRDYRKTPINTECKYLLLRHAFEEQGAIRVQLKTDSRNLVSQQAIARIGGVREGVLRQHVIMPDGYLRDSVYFSILDREWPAVKANLEAKLATYA